MTQNRQIDTKSNLNPTVQLEVTRSGIMRGKQLEQGEVIEVSKTEAKRMLTIHKGLFKIKID